MAYFSFANAIMAGEPITLYDGGRLRRDFTYIDDIVAGVIGCLDRPPAGAMPPRLLNIGNHRSELVNKLVQLLERELGRPAIVREAPRPAADVEETFASVESIAALTGFTPKTTLEEGIPRFAAWFKAWRTSREET
jgi:UDP-glucuronate 4-epimerase